MYASKLHVPPGEGSHPANSLKNEAMGTLGKRAHPTGTYMYTIIHRAYVYTNFISQSPCSGN